jgi:hypothetical protein
VCTSQVRVFLGHDLVVVFGRKVKEGKERRKMTEGKYRWKKGKVKEGRTMKEGR